MNENLEIVDALINTTNMTGIKNYLEDDKQEKLLDLLLDLRHSILQENAIIA